MSEERLKEIKDMIDSDYDFCRKFGIDFAIPEKELELYNEVISLQKRNKEIYDGFIATQEELSDYAKENERLTNELNTCMIERNNFLSRKEKAVEYIKLRKEICERQENMTGINILVELLNILNGRSDE